MSVTTASTVRTRFAPSPTGFLHIGGARTALFSWLYARRHHGQFVLRIEDTDIRRATPDSAQAILAGLEWLGLDYDEGPVYQSQRLSRYREVAAQLLEQDYAYQCHCTPEELAAMRAAQLRRGEKPRYDRRCRERTRARSYVKPTLRFKTPLDGSVSFCDCVYGEVRVQNSELDDLVLLRSDGVPTYNFSVVVDDMDMRVTHVVRGDDHLSNTPRQIHLLRAIDKTMALPRYAHVPMIFDVGGKRLSKRSGAASVTDYRGRGYLPEALCNYLVRLGWAHGDQEIFSRAEMIRYFDFAHVGKAAAVFNPSKLDWLNRHYLQAAAASEMAAMFAEHLRHAGYGESDLQTAANIFATLRSRHDTMQEMARGARFVYRAPTVSDIAAGALSAEQKVWLECLHQSLQVVPEWTKAAIQATLDRTLSHCNIALRQLGPILRRVLTSGTPSPDLTTTIWLIGRTESCTRLHRGATFSAPV